MKSEIVRAMMRYARDLVSFKDISGIYFFSNVIETFIISVCNNDFAHFLEFLKIIYNGRAEEGFTVLQRRFVNDNCDTFRTDPLHNALNRGLAEVVGVALHRQTIYSHDYFGLFGRIPLAICSIGTGQLQYAIRDKILSGAVTFYNRGHHILRNILEVRQQLFGIFGSSRHNRRTDCCNVFQYGGRGRHRR